MRPSLIGTVFTFICGGQRFCQGIFTLVEATDLYARGSRLI
jgi:hypothetical protein